MRMRFRVEERSEHINRVVKVTLWGVAADGSKQYGTYMVTTSEIDPSVADWHVGDLIEATLEKDTAGTDIAEAEAAGIEPVMLA